MKLNAVRFAVAVANVWAIAGVSDDLCRRLGRAIAQSGCCLLTGACLGKW